MTNILATTALALFLTGTVAAQQKPTKRAATTKSTTGMTPTNDVIRTDPSAANTHDGTQAATIGTNNKGANVGTGLTNGQNQAVSRPAKRTVNIKSSNGVSPMNDENGVNQSAVSAEEHKTNVPAGIGGTPKGTGLTNDQNQAANSSIADRPTKVDAQSSVRTGASPVKPKMKAPKKDN